MTKIPRAISETRSEDQEFSWSPSDIFIFGVGFPGNLDPPLSGGRGQYGRGNETGHSYTGPLAYETHASALNKHSGLFAPIDASMKRQNYHSWINCVDEHVNRAVTARIMEQIYDNNTAQRELADKMTRDFIYTK